MSVDQHFRADGLGERVRILRPIVASPQHLEYVAMLAQVNRVQRALQYGLIEATAIDALGRGVTDKIPPGKRMASGQLRRKAT